MFSVELVAMTSTVSTRIVFLDPWDMRKGALNFLRRCAASRPSRTTERRFCLFIFIPNSSYMPTLAMENLPRSSISKPAIESLATARMVLQS